ncbi:MAG: DUF898 family protein [Pseudomonadota bacterium]
MRQLSGEYHGTAMPLFIIYFKVTVLTLFTLGIYRFWGKTRIRRYIWSATSGGDDSFEYTGTGLEKFLGFLVAVVLLAIYLGIVQMLLFYFGIVIFDEPQTDAEVLAQLAGIYITLVAAVPLIFFAQYRARRYKMSRTRWRGIRFGMEHGAWGYVLRAIFHITLTISTLGLLLPRQTFYLEKYMADRTWYGNAQFEQGGKWTGLYAGLTHVIMALAVMILGGFMAADSSPIFGTILIVLGYFWLLIGFVAYRIYAFNYMMKHKKLAGEVAFDSEAETGRVIGIVLGGSFIVTIVALIAGVFFALLAAAFGVLGAFSGLEPLSATTQQGVMGITVMAIYYVALLLVIPGVSLVVITQRIIAHVVGAITVQNAAGLDAIRQRMADEGADAEGFADALDVGGAI